MEQNAKLYRLYAELTVVRKGIEELAALRPNPRVWTHEEIAHHDLLIKTPGKPPKKSRDKEKRSPRAFPLSTHRQDPYRRTSEARSLDIPGVTVRPRQGRSTFGTCDTTTSGRSCA